MKKKRVKQLILNTAWKISSAESWYSAMAEKGLHLKGIGNIFVTLEKGEPGRRKYRIDIIGSYPTEDSYAAEALAEERLKLYEECGWNFVAKNRKYYIFASPEEANCPEPYKDSIEHGHTLTALNKRLRNRAITVAIYVLFVMGMIGYCLLFEPSPMLLMVRENGIMLPLLLGAILFLLYMDFQDAIYISRLRRKLLKEKPVNIRKIGGKIV